MYDESRHNGLDVYYYDGERGFVGGVYFAQGVDGGPIKIGWSSTLPEERLKSLQVGSPAKLKIISRVEFANRRLEVDLHLEFSDDRLHGEWFEPSVRLLRWIRRYGESPMRQSRANGAYSGFWKAA
jgi:hypothetical protein